MSHRFRSKLVYAVLASALVLGLSQHALASIVDFTGDAQTFGASITGSGNYDVTGADPYFVTLLGTGYKLTPAEQTGNVALLNQPIIVNSHPQTRGIDTTSAHGPYNDGSNNPLPNTTDFEAKNGHMEGAFGVGIDLLNGSKMAVGISNIILISQKYNVGSGKSIGPPYNFGIGLNPVTFNTLYFSQTGTATFVDGAHNTGTFDIPGVIGGTVTATIALDTNGLNYKITTDLNLHEDFHLTGTYTLDNGPPKNLGMSLDGGVNLSLPLSLNEAVTETVAPGSGLTGTIIFNSSINLALNYHLQGVMVPEPGSVILLGIGLLAVVPIVRNGLRKK
jgi:hypothetical protein